MDFQQQMPIVQKTIEVAVHNTTPWWKEIVIGVLITVLAGVILHFFTKRQ